MILPLTSHSITVSVPVCTSSKVHSIKLGTTMLLFHRSSKLSLLFEMGVEMVRDSEYMLTVYSSSFFYQFQPELKPKYLSSPNGFISSLKPSLNFFHKVGTHWPSFILWPFGHLQSGWYIAGRPFSHFLQD